MFLIRKMSPLESQLAKYRTEINEVDRSYNEAKEEVDRLREEWERRKDSKNQLGERKEELIRNEEKFLVDYLLSAAEKLELRSKLYQNGDLIDCRDEDKKREDEKIVELYENNTAIFVNNDQFQSDYKAAKNRLAAKNEAEAIIVLNPDGEIPGHLYVAVNYDKQDEGLMGSLVDIVQNVLAVNKNIKYAAPNNKDGLLYLHIKSGYDELSEALSTAFVNEEFDEALVEYIFIDARNLSSSSGEEPKKVTSSVTSNSIDNIMVQNNNEVDKKKVSGSVNNEELYLKTPKEIQAITGMRYSSLGYHIEQGSIKTNEDRLIDRGSLEDFITQKNEAELKMYDFSELASYVQKKCGEVLDDTSISYDLCKSLVKRWFDNNSLASIKENNKRFTSNFEIDRKLINYFAHRKLASFKEAEIKSLSRDQAADLLNVSRSTLSGYIKSERLICLDDSKNSSIRTDSITNFLKNNTYWSSWYKK